MIVDGYNAIHRIEALSRRLDASLESARTALLTCCGVWTSNRRDVSLITVVFDGDSSVLGGRSTLPYGVRAVYTRTKEAADDRILRMLEDRRGRGGETTVVSDDGYVRRNAASLGARVMSVAVFWRTLNGRPVRRGAAETSAATDDGPDLSAHEAAAITEALKKEWGLE